MRLARLKLAALELQRSQAFVYEGRGAKDPVVNLRDDTYKAPQVMIVSI